MKNWNRIVMTLLAVLFSSGLAFAADERDERVEKARDKAAYDQLVGQVRQVEGEYKQLLSLGMKEARESNGSASLATQSKIIAAREKRDRLLNRLLVVSLRWGWDMPDFNATDSTGGAVATVRTQADQVFEPAASVIKANFAKEAVRIAETVKLPVISLPQNVKQGGV